MNFDIYSSRFLPCTPMINVAFRATVKWYRSIPSVNSPVKFWEPVVSKPSIETPNSASFTEICLWSDFKPSNVAVSDNRLQNTPRQIFTIEKRHDCILLCHFRHIIIDSESTYLPNELKTVIASSDSIHENGRSEGDSEMMKKLAKPNSLFN